MTLLTYPSTKTRSKKSLVAVFLVLGVSATCQRPSDLLLSESAAVVNSLFIDHCNRHGLENASRRECVESIGDRAEAILTV
jgi:hypothetical protein